MSRRSLSLVFLAVLVVGGAGTAAILLTQSAFQGAPAGVAVTFQSVALPDVRWPASQPIPSDIARTNGFTPGVVDLVAGDFVITSEPQMRIVWKRLFAVPYDPTLFDFHQTFVVLMGGGAQDITSFGITDVEDVAATWTGIWPGSGTVVDRFLAVTATTFIPGTFPQNPPPPTYRVSAVKVPQSLLDHVVFHRTIVPGI